VNNPASGAQRAGKIIRDELPAADAPTLISRDLARSTPSANHGAVVMKPLHGHGGAAVFRVMPQDMNFGSLFDMFSVTFKEPWVIQRFLPRSSMRQADHLVDGEFAGAVTACRRRTICAPTWWRRRGAGDDLSDREREICATLGPALRERGLLFVGIDVIDRHLTEINVTRRRHSRHRRLGGRMWPENLGNDRGEAGQGLSCLHPAADADGARTTNHARGRQATGCPISATRC